MNKTEALKQAIEALMEHGTAYLGHSKEYQLAVIKSKEALAQPERQPLTDEQIADYLGDKYLYMTQSDLSFFKLGEKAAHGIKELNT